MMKSRVELLAPAGNYEAFLGAVNAGADAVYLGGDRYGARAYADNFTTEEICRALRTAHFMGKKIYLTVNTLLKDVELEDLYNWLLPVYEAGLDGVIVQDIGVLHYIREYFKDLPLHASTQMSLTGPGGAMFLKEQGVVRIVPARELSLAEVRRIREETGLEVECFIHGAMCYCYSGQCLFSSILGGRSGNRGTCAQPCRLPYQIYRDEAVLNGPEYPLSLKDMCTVAYIPQLIEAGIDSFKIEGRMKKPEYAAGVTALYRKYIDLYYERGRADYHVDKKDLRTLYSLYIRSDVQNGYYERYNGVEMITPQKPGYAGADETYLERIRARYIHEPDRLPVRMHAIIKAGQPASLQITSDMGPDGQNVCVTVQGDNVQPAQKMPLQPETVRKQLEKTGGSNVRVVECVIEMPEDVFMPVSALNQLRRDGVDAFERRYIRYRGLPDAREVPDVKQAETEPRQTGSDEKPPSDDFVVTTLEQLQTAVWYPCRRIYIESDLYVLHREQVRACMMAHGGPAYYLALPYVIRERDEEYLRRLSDYLGQETEPAGAEDTASEKGSLIEGFLVRNYEEAAYVRSLRGSYETVPDAGLYVFNTRGADFWRKYCGEITLPYELNAQEMRHLAGYAHRIGMRSAMIVYSRIPMMVTANCIRKTAGQCGGTGSLSIRDRYGTYFPVETNCAHCYNIIYNSVPYSLHLQDKEIRRTGADVRRYDFTTESSEDCRRILDKRDFPYEKYTTGHLKRGVE